MLFSSLSNGLIDVSNIYVQIIDEAVSISL